MSVLASEIETGPVEHLPETGSTNEDALAAARAGRIGPLWVRADLQQAGRGRQGRAWSSPRGNLYCSLLLAVDAEPALLPQLSHVAAVALGDALRPYLPRGADLRIKWPNDLLLDHAKVAGILVEGTRRADGQQFCVIGCGVNCGSFPEGLPYPATSLVSVGARLTDPSQVFARLRASLGQAVATWDNGRGYAAIRQRWLASALPIDTPLVVRGFREPMSGRFQGIDESGRLLLMGPYGPVTVEAGEVNLN